MASLRIALLSFLLGCFIQLSAQQNVGIGTTDPSARLDIVSNYAASTLLAEGFEDGSLGDLSTTGDANWAAQQAPVYDGSYAARSGGINATQSTSIIISGAIPPNKKGALSFYITWDLGDHGILSLDGSEYTGQKTWVSTGELLDPGPFEYVITVFGDGTNNDAGYAAIDLVSVTYEDGHPLRIADGREGQGKILVSDEYGNAEWTVPDKPNQVEDNDGDTYVRAYDNNTVKVFANGQEVLDLRQSSLTSEVDILQMGRIRDSLGSVSIGNGSATGPEAMAWGTSTATGLRSTAWGQGATASDLGATAFGLSSEATGLWSTAFGYEALADTTCAVAWGLRSHASGRFATAFGQSDASGSYSTAWGAETIASGQFSTAWGTYATASAYGSTAWGASSLASGIRSTSWGIETQATGDESTAWGNLAAATADYATAWGVETNASDYSSTAWGVQTNTSGFNSTAWGFGTDASGYSSTAWGLDTDASASLSTAWGEWTNASGENSTAWGEETNASGWNSTAWGEFATASGTRSTAWGRSTIASALHSTAWGEETTASASSSTAWGLDTDASGGFSTTWGRNNVAKGLYSTAWGRNTQAISMLSTTLGRNNVIYGGQDTIGWEANDPLFAIGNGTSDTDRRDAVIVLKNGNFGIGRYPLSYFHMYKETSADARFEAETGDVDLIIDGTSGNNALEFHENGAFQASIGWSAENNRLFFYQNSTNAMFVSNGNVGIKHPTPTYDLDMPNSSTNGTARAFQWLTYSDRRVKDKILPLKYGLKDILALKPVQYDQHEAAFNNGTLELSEEHNHTIGLIAQEVHELIPEAVSMPEDENADLWGMDYEKLVPVLVKAIQDQQEIIEAQKFQLKSQSDRLAKLEALFSSREQATTTD